MKINFSLQDQELIRTAVSKAEKETGAEIVPVIVAASDFYEEAGWRAGISALAMALSLSVLALRMNWLWWPLASSYLAVGLLTLTGLAYLLAATSPALKRLFAGRALMDRRCHQRARQSFLEEEVFKTADRTGVLIFISLLERSVVVLGDSGINARVQPEEWETVVRLITDGIKTGDSIGGLEKAILQCGQLTARLGIAIKRDDKNELPDNLRAFKS